MFAGFAYSQSYPCLPAEVKEDTVVRVIRGPEAKPGVNRRVTVKQTLKDLKAKCHRGRLLDAKKKEVRFYRLVGCWGNPPMDYLEIKARQASELADLKKMYTVIEMRCDIGDPPRYRP